MEQPTSHPIDRSTKQFGKNTTTMPQQTQQSYIVIDAKPQVTKEDLLNVIVELKNILKSSIKVLSPEANQP